MPDPEKTKNHPVESLLTRQDKEFSFIDLKEITPDQNQPRQHFDEQALKELSQSIKEKGVLQPVIIRIDKNKKIWLVAGERRYRAAQMAGLEKIPAILTKGNPEEIALIENIQRQDLNPIEEAEAYNRIIERQQYTQEQLSKIVGKGRTTITEILTLNKLPDQIKKECRTSDISKSVLIEIAKQKDNQAMLDLFKQVKQGELKNKDVRKVTRKKSEKNSQQVILTKKVQGLKKSLEKLKINNIDNQTEFLQELEELDHILKKLMPRFYSSQ